MEFLLRPLTGDNVAQERDELIAGMAWCGLADHRHIYRIECGKQVESAVLPGDSGNTDPYYPGT
ncbi:MULTISPECIES: hypothetical protein [Cupriavidus]|uniref:hypothetical protein n=1 Tax=Cupriavidus TaxID=106589 RepID=UPI001E4E2A6D|nr:hypothetical protein [Cupriavidus taiwanensis]